MNTEDEYITLYKLYFRPGYYSHPQRWEAAGLSQWQNDYKIYPGLRPEIDRQLRESYKWSWPEKGFTLNAMPRQLIVWIDKIPILLLALGLLFLECPDYLTLQYYRKELSHTLGEIALNQISMFWQGGSQRPLVEPEDLCDHAFSAGLALFDKLLITDPVGPMIMQTLPLVDSTEDSSFFSQATNEKVWRVLRSLGRFI